MIGWLFWIFLAWVLYRIFRGPYASFDDYL